MSSTVKVMVGTDGADLLGEGRARLLELIDRRRSLRKAAAEMGMSYRHAWGVIKHLEDAFKQPLVESRRGGSSGGGTVLTPHGRRLLDEYNSVRSAALSAMVGELVRVTVVLVIKGSDGRLAVVDGRLPRGSVSTNEPIDAVLGRLRSLAGKRVMVSKDPSVISEDDGGLLLLYKGSSDERSPGSCSPEELPNEDRDLLRKAS